MNWKKVDADALDASLTTVADAIRDSYGFKEKVDFPQGYVDMVDRATEMCRIMIESTNDAYFYFPKGLKKIAERTFDTRRWVKFPVNFPEGLEVIEYYAFHNCFNITEVVLPSSLTSIASSVFENCVNLTKVTFKSKPAITNNPFLSCGKLATINVPWAEGEVAGAPWGATNATINYNYTGV